MCGVSTLFPQPQEATVLPGQFTWPDNRRELAISQDWPAERTPRLQRCGLNFRVEPSDDPWSFRCGVPGRPPRERLPWVGKDGYLLEVTPDGISGLSNSGAGLGYALDTLCQLMNGEGRVTCARIVDRPICEHRGIMLDIARVVEQPNYVISLLPFLSECRINQIYVYFENKLVFKCDPELAHPCAWTHDEVKQLVREAQRWEIEVIPVLATLGHMESILKHPHYSHLAEPHTADHLAIHRPEARQFLTRILEEVCELFPGRYIHLGGDECPYLGRSLAVGKTTPRQSLLRTYADGMNFLCDYLRKYERRPLIWADMISHHWELADRLHPAFIPVHWQYGPCDQSDSATPEQLKRKGFEVAVAPAILADEPFLPLAERLEKNIPYLPRHTGLWGIITCVWEPRTQTLPVTRIGMSIAGASSWNPFIQSASQLLSVASRHVYECNLSETYRRLADPVFVHKMCQTRLGYYHAFELICSNPVALMDQPQDPQWNTAVETIKDGMKLLLNEQRMAGRYPTDFQAFVASGHLALFLAERQSVMRTGGRLYRDPNTSRTAWMDFSKQVRQLASQAEIALAAQHSAWNATRRSNDLNFQWWFCQPLTFQHECLIDLAEQIEHAMNQQCVVDLSWGHYLKFHVSRGNSASWNLLRLRICFSWDCDSWSQMFFRTVPLWMDEEVEFSLMPRRGLPKFVRIEPSCWCWREAWGDLPKMIRWELRRLCADVRRDEFTRTGSGITSRHADYELETSRGDEMLLRLIET